MNSVILCRASSRILALFEFLLNSLVTTLNLISLPLELILGDLLLLELFDKNSLFFFDLTSDSVLFHESLLEVLNADGNAITFVLPEEWLGCDVTNSSLDIVSRLLRIL